MKEPRLSRSLTGQVLAVGVALGVCAALAFALLLSAIRSLDAANDQTERAVNAVREVSELERRVIDAETGQRGFIITGQRAFLVPTTAARADIADRKQAVLDLLDEPGQRAVFASLSRQIDAYFRDWIARTIRIAERSRAEARALVATGEGRRRVDAMRGEFDAIRAGLQSEVGRRQAAVGDRVSSAVVLASGGVVLSVLLFAAYAAFVARSVVFPVRRVADAARRLTGGDRAARVHDADTTQGEIGDMARSFNTMADTLEQGHDELEAQGEEVARYAEELEAQRTELEHTVAALEAEKTRIEMISAFGEAVTQETRFAPLAHLILNGVADAARCDAGVLYVRDARRGGDLALATVRGVDRSQVPEILLPGDGLAGRAAVEARPVTGERSADAPKVGTVSGPATVAHEVHVPLLQGGEVFGVISLGRVSDVPFDHGDVLLIAHLTDQSGVALSKAVVMRELRRRETIMRAVLDAAPDPIALIDDQGHAVVANEPMRQYLSLLRELELPDVDEGIIRDEIQDPERGHLFTRYIARLQDAEVGLHGRMVVLRDVTAEREAERVKEEFFALVSHELRTPLTSIIGYLELLREDGSGPDGTDPAAAQRSQFLAVVDRNARRLLRLVGDLLFVAQVEAGKLSLEEGEVDLEAVARESVEAAGPRAARGGVQLTLEADHIGVWRGDRDRLAQALDNLVSNAIKFTPDGGKVTVRLHRTDENAVIEVEDTGIGISSDDLRRLFERFFRTRRATSAAIPGVGLGLSIAQAIVHGHEGEISVSSQEGQGTTFRIQLPLRAPARVPA